MCNCFGASTFQTTTMEASTYVKLDELDHIIKRPDTFIGSCVASTKPTFAFSHQDGLVFEETLYVEGLSGIFDEILVNAADHKTRNPSSMTYLHVSIGETSISVKNNGPGILVEEHPKYHEWIPEMIFGSLRTSSNFNDQTKKLTGGRNGFGAKLTNIFSSKFQVETTDARNLKKFKMQWQDHMTKKSPAKISSTSAKPISSTCITFEPDLKLFHGISKLAQLEKVLAKRVLDVAGTCARVTVKLNGQKMPVRGFKEYVNYVAKAMGVQTNVAYVKTNDRWEIAICASPREEAQDISFVNHIETPNGGTHVRSVRKALETELRRRLEKKVGTKVAPSKIHNNLLVFVNCKVENPTFGSQTKIELTTQSAKFGQLPGIAAKHFAELFKQSDIMRIIEERSQAGLGSKPPSTTKARVVREDGLKDANWAGSKKSHLCRLILTEGLSAATLATSGREKAGGPNINGIYPLRGKLFNPCSGAQDAKKDIVTKKKELNAIVRILNMKSQVDYTLASNRKTLRYGQLVIMVDQDKDGSHIGGLILNFLKWWNPTILKVPHFVHQFITPVLKATSGKKVRSFFSEQTYAKWFQTLEEPQRKKFKIKYYKGLGTSTAKEAKAYFSDLSTHLLDLEPLTDQASSQLDVAFSGSKKAQRKTWISQHGGTKIQEPDFTTKPRTYDNFLNSSLLEYNDSTIVRAIPSMLDGLKEVQRKILFTCFTKNLTTEKKVAEVASLVSQVTKYHHGEASLMSTLIGMAQRFVGKNNINLLVPAGQFGTRLSGGADAASPRYIFTRLDPLARFFFPEDDDPILEYLEEEGQNIEPRHFAPVVPMSLVNGAKGIATGWSTSLPMYNPLHVIDYFLHDLRNEEPKKTLEPWYCNFRGKIVAQGSDFVTKGIYEFGQNNKVRILELPIGSWTEPFLAQTLNLRQTKAKASALVVTKHADHSSDLEVNVVLTLRPESYAKYSQDHELFEQDFKLTSVLRMTNIHLLDSSGRIRKYENVDAILADFTTFRLQMYTKRKTYLLKRLAEKTRELEAKIRFIEGILDKSIPLGNVPRQITINAMSHLPREFHDAFLKMALSSLHTERVEELRKQTEEIKARLVQLKKTSVQQMWIWDLEQLKSALNKPSKRKHSQ